ncbi:MAG: hypothetical protein HC878_20165, partial [Leptolyngbyaceae cyanobacterium SL_5_14]|nr:hypothetical protein [Leptolyngbyaceae cyanobacterium SL_5_14]
MINIVTSVCIDTEIEDESVDYPMLRLKRTNSKRETYWKCATVLMSTVSRLCPNAKHFIFTNDPDSVNINGIDVNSFLSNIGTEVRYLSFNEFKTPSNLSKRFKNAFYKHEVAYDLGKSQAGYSILLDSDCLWTKQENDVYPFLEKDKVLLYDVYERNNPFLKEPHNLSMADMGKLFKE